MTEEKKVSDRTTENGPTSEDDGTRKGEISPLTKTELEDEVDASRDKAQEYLEGWQRSRAEFANYKKRIMREKKDIHKVARAEVIKLYLDIADDLGRALQDRPEEGEGAAWAKGIELIYKKLLTRLESEGVERMDAEGEIFDPNIHEAVFQEENDQYESGRVIEVIQDGYYLGDKVLRPALVRVAA
ncbi:MAG: nucleotide exchange factor GrpE [Anaerolineales bacterium]|nr:nucleotide exchange factor GrpE [Anaerolineales bacterium]